MNAESSVAPVRVEMVVRVGVSLTAVTVTLTWTAVVETAEPS